VWWGGSRETLTIPLYSDCLGGFTDGESISASVNGRQKSCGSVWQMNAGRSARTDCGHALRLTLDSEIENPWLSDINLEECEFTTHPLEPVVINAHRWHDPLAEAVIGTLVLQVNVAITTST